MTDDESFIDGMSKIDPDDATSASWSRLIALARVGAAVNTTPTRDKLLEALKAVQGIIKNCTGMDSAENDMLSEADKIIAAALEAAEAYAGLEGDALETVDYVGRIAVLENIDRQRREQISRLQDTIEKYQNKTPEALSQPVMADGWKALENAAKEFVRKVEAGEAKSQKSYSQFKAALESIAASPVPVERREVLEEAKRAADEIAGNTADFGRDHRRGAGAVSAAISVLIATSPPLE